MKIITVNLPQSYIDAIECLTGDDALYPSRSELIRVAVRDFLIKELEASKAFVKYQNTVTGKPIEDSLFVQVPSDNSNGYKTYRIVKK